MTDIEHFVLVDFENVPAVDLQGIEGKPVQVVLLVGAQQKTLNVDLVEQMLGRSTQVELIKVGKSGRNALDITLAYYLGVAAKEHPDAAFYIVSKDKDFEPMIAHLKSKGLRLTRHNSFALPFLAPPKRARTAAPFVAVKKTVAPLPAPAPKPAAAKPKTELTLLDKVIARLETRKDLPKSIKSLERLVASQGDMPTPAEVSAVVQQLAQRRLLTIDAKGKVSYPSL